MINNLNINGVTYQNVAKLRVKKAGANTYADLIDTSDANATSSDIIIGKTAYINGTKVVGTKTLNAISPKASGTLIIGDNQLLTENVISFFDEYGLLLYTIDTTDSSQFPLESLPTPPSVTGYTITWDKTLEQVNAMTTGGFVSSHVVANSLTPTYIYPISKGWYNETTQLYFRRASSTNVTLSIDWGDGSTSSLTLSYDYQQSVNHTYTTNPTNPIVITPNNSAGYYLGGNYNASRPYQINPLVNGYANTSYYQNGFRNGYRVEEIRMGDGAKIYYDSFVGLASLKKIIIPEGTDLFDCAFGGCASLVALSFPTTVTNIPQGLCSNRMIYSTSYAKYMYEIGGMSYCNSLETVIFPESATITSMDTYAFFAAQKLKNIKLPTLTGSTKTIGMYSFYNCYNLISINIPNGYTGINDNAFTGCYGLKGISLPDTLTTIGNYVFSACYNMKNVEFGNGITTIGNSAFAYCALSQISLPDTLTTIGSSAFGNDLQLQSVAIGNGITSIGNGAFSQSYSLNVFTIDAITPPTLSGTIFPLTDISTSSSPKALQLQIFVPSGSLSSYQSATNWSVNANAMYES